MAGRHHLFRLHPLSVKEISGKNPDIVVEKLLQNSGFPEPYLAKSDKEVAVLIRSHLDVI